MKIVVTKRNGDLVSFEKSKIEKAILKAMIAYNGIENKAIAHAISVDAEDEFSKFDEVSIAMIERFVFKQLCEYGLQDVARCYESYRTVQEHKRIANTTDEGILGLIKRTNDELLEENSNKNGVLISTQRDLIAGEVSKDIARRKLLPSNVVQAHDKGAIHIHDMDYLLQPMHNCCLVNLEDMLQNGTVINEKKVEKPKSFQTACTITTQIVSQVASSQYGGQSITIAHIAPFLKITREKYEKLFSDIEDSTLRKSLVERMVKKELKDGIQTIRYQLSTLMTTNGQAPFVTIYLEVRKGHEFEKEMAMICEEIMKQRITGMKNEKEQRILEAFPKLVYLLDEHNCLEGGEYDYLTKIAVECSNKTLAPDYQSAKFLRQNYGDTFPPMGCRSHLSPWKDENGDLKWYGRFNQGVVSLNLPQVAILAKGKIGLFWQILDSRLELCKEALMCRHNLLKGTISDVSPIHWQHGALARLEKGETIDRLLMDGYSTISLGYVGIHEMCEALIGESNTTERGKELSLKVMNYMRNKCDEWKAETGLGFSVYGTPAESLVYRFCRLDRENFGKIPNVTDKLYYTNSYHVNVTEEIDAFTKLQYESEFHAISSGGCISYIELADMSKNIEALEQVVNFMYHNIQYAEINTKVDICYECGYTGEMKINPEKYTWYCPNCGNHDHDKMQVVRRTCGYIGSNYWNKGKTQEINERVLHL